MAQFLELANERLSLRVSEQGGAIVDGYTNDGRPFLRPYGEAGDAFDVLRSACFPLVPICNRVEGNSFEMDGKHYRFEPNTGERFYIHGDGWLGRWTVEHMSATEVRLSFTQERPDKSPHVYRAMQTISLDGPSLRVGLSVSNCGAESMPLASVSIPTSPARMARS